ncbi:GntR family transcriptional regulator [Stappia sp. 22II-S9-Z10]|nr:GntR family transcriptional regulator [Stappia sp. 22II-S9-Z10]
MAEDIYSRIRSLIADGTYIGGDVLPEGELANRLGVSRTPIREALRRLQAEGVIQREAYRRAVVTETDPDEVIHIFTMRAAVEPIAVGLAVQYVDEAFIAKLRDLHARMDGAIGEVEPDRRAYREYNAAFHRVIWAQGGNAMMADMINAIARRPVVSPTFNNWTRAELTRSNRQHGELVDALEARDAEWAETTMRAHLLSSRASYRRIGEDRRRAKGTANGAAPGVDTSAEEDADAR